VVRKESATNLLLLDYLANVSNVVAAVIIECAATNT